ncbi:MAG: lysozyme inhibitor LprI family protein [Sphingopyxis sp.]
MMILMSLALAAAQAEPPLECYNTPVQPELNECAYNEYERADAELNRQWRITLEHMREIDREHNRDARIYPRIMDTASGVEHLMAAQRAWLIFRDNHCVLDPHRNFGGAMEPMLYYGCLTGLTRDRSAQLKQIVEYP